MMQDTDELLGVTLDENERLRSVIKKLEARLAEMREARDAAGNIAERYHARLTKAERLLERAVADDFDGADVESIYDFLRPADKVKP